MAVVARIAFAVLTADIEQRQRREAAMTEWYSLMDSINKITDRMKKNIP